jgi:4-amino-4-deoxy-L-arabinose transferase-like glycosyltransferase
MTPVSTHTARPQDPSLGPPRAPTWLSWRTAIYVIAAATVLRLVYSIWLSPWDLVGDEAYYWLQAKHLDLCYNEKGPLLAWLIAASCRLFGDVEWAVRLPVLVGWALGAWGTGRLALAATRDQRVASISSYLYLLVPGFQANAQMCTQDGVLIPLWIALTALTLRQFQRWKGGRGACGGWSGWLLLWALLGIGMLLKQSVLTFLPGLAIFWLVERRGLPLRPAFFLQQLAGVAVLVLFCAPMIVWNAQHDWPMLAHTVGHLSGGGDQAGHRVKGNPLSWEGAVLGGLLAAFGPLLLVMIWAAFREWRGTTDDRFAQRWLIISAWFSTLFYIALALTKPVIASWPLPNMAPALIPAAAALAPILSRQLSNIHLRRFWRAGIAYGIIAAALLAFPNALAAIPSIHGVLQKRLFAGLSGGHNRGRQLAAVLAEAQGNDPRQPLILAPSYSMAALTTFYVPGHPHAAARDSHLTNRPSTLDHWPETNLDNPIHEGRTLVLVLDHRNDPPDWESVLLVDQVRPSSDPTCLIATNFRGYRANILASQGGPR